MCMGGASPCIAGKLEAAVDGKRPFTLLLDDPAGNSYVECPAGSTLGQDPLLTLERYERTAAQAAAIGLLPRGDEPDQAMAAALQAGLPEIAEDDVHHGAAPVGAAAAHRGLARSDFCQLGMRCWYLACLSSLPSCLRCGPDPCGGHARNSLHCILHRSAHRLCLAWECVRGLERALQRPACTMRCHGRLCTGAFACSDITQSHSL